MNATLNSLRSRLSPECGGMTNTVLILGVVQVIALVTIAVLVLFSYIYYSSDMSAGEAKEVEKKKKRTKFMLIAAVVVSSLTALSGLWLTLLSGKIKNCIAVANVQG